MKNSIELFSGSGQVSAILKSKGFKTLTIDINPKFNPQLCVDILDLTLEDLPGTVDFLWASPDCSKLSRAAAQRHWKKETVSYRSYKYTALTSESKKSIQLIEKTVSLICALNPKVWFIENPVGRLPHLQSMRSLGHYRYCVNYADWGFPYSKETYIFTNQLLPLPTIVQKRFGNGLRSVEGSYKRSLIPAGLLHFLIDYSTHDCC